MKSKKILKQICAYVLGAVLSIVNIYSISYANTSNIKTECYEQNGIQYKIVYTYIGDKVDISIRTDDSNDILKLERNGKRITVEQLEYQGRTFFGSYKYDENVLYDNMDEDLLKKRDVNPEAYGKKVYDAWKHKFWYSKNSTSTALYYRIGCVATYELNYNKLDSTYQGYMNNYVSSINKCNNSYNKALASSGADAVIAIIDLIIILSVTVPIAGLVSIIVALVGGLGVTVKHLVDSYSYHLDAQHYYDIVKYKGKKM